VSLPRIKLLDIKFDLWKWYSESVLEYDSRSSTYSLMEVLESEAEVVSLDSKFGSSQDDMPPLRAVSDTESEAGTSSDTLPPLQSISDSDSDNDLGDSSDSVRGTPASDGFPSRPNPDAPDASGASGASPDGFLPGAPDTSAPFYPTTKPPGTSVRSRWNVLCDQARDHCRYLRTCATG
jgi:hypothetical protein